MRAASGLLLPAITVVSNGATAFRSGAGTNHAIRINRIICGVSVNVAITNLVFDAVNAGYQVIVPRDAVAGLPPAYVESVFEHTLSVLATVTTTTDLIAVWDGLARSGS